MLTQTYGNVGFQAVFGTLKSDMGATELHLSFLCAFRAVRPGISLWYNCTVRKRVKNDACEVMQLIGRAHDHVAALVTSFL